jgi:Spy/CpxP family protein refolding chaperone
MASRRFAMTALTALALAASLAVLPRLAADQPAGKNRERLAAWATKLGLSSDQQERIHKICEEYAEKAEPTEEQLWKLHHEAMDAVKGVLTPEQQEKLTTTVKTVMGRECRELADKFGLSEEQRQKVERIREEYEPKFREVCAQGNETSRKQMRQLRSEFFGDIRQVLNDEQKAKAWGVLRQEFHQWRDPVARHQHLEAIGEQLGVSADQKAQIKKIHDEFKPRIEKLATQLKDTFHEERESIAKILTDEQRTKAQEMWKDIAGRFDFKGRE